jgi:hypothetical protein
MNIEEQNQDTGRVYNGDDIRPYSQARTKLEESIIKRFMFRDRRPRLTKLGHAGLMPSTSRLGDKICALLGGSVYYALRSVSGGKHIFVGEVYLVGLMDDLMLNKPLETFALI